MTGTRQHYNGHTGKPKKPYRTIEEVHTAKRRMEARYHTKLNIYICTVCGRWHLGNAKYIPHQDRTLERIINWFKRVFL